MAASYPSSIIVLATINNGDTSDASNINTPNAEIVAIETGLLNGFQHDLKPLTDNANDLGNSTHAWKNLWTKGTVQLNGITYTFPAADGTNGQSLQTNGSKVLSWATATPIANEFRLSLTSATSVTTADVTAATTLYLTPHVGRRMTIFDGSGNATTLTSAEISIAVPATTSTLYDVFVYNNGGVLTLELLAWTNDTTRATAIVKTGGVDAAGVLTKSGDTTRRYVGSFRTTTVSGQTEDSVTKRYVWNYVNRVARVLLRQETTATWTYTTATIRQANGSTSNQVDVVVGVAEVPITLAVTGMVSNANAVAVGIGIGEDSTTALSASHVGGAGNTTGLTNAFTPMLGMLTKVPAIGRHVYAWLEFSTAAGSSTWYGAPGAPTAPSGTPNGLTGRIDG